MVIVAGITRSGLSLTMQMLAAGGYPCAGTFPDFEPFMMGEIPWGECGEQAVKLVDAHLHLPPDGRYDVILLRRNRTEQARSINKWSSALFGLSAPIAALLGSLRRDYAVIDEWADKQRCLFVEFEDLILRTEGTAVRIAEFVGRQLDIGKMVKAVVPRGTDCYPTLLETELVARFV